MTMTVRSIACFLAGLLLASTTGCVPADNPYGKVTVPFEVKQVPDTSVHYVIGQPGVPGPDNQGFMSNAGFVVTVEGVVVYDALGTPALGCRLIQAIRRVTNKPIRVVVAGHYHADHIYGLQAFKEHTRTEIWAQERAWAYIESPEAEQRLAQRREALKPWVDDKTYVVKPDKTFKDRHVFDMGDTRIELIHVGPAHSPDDIVMVVKEAGVVFSGDLIFSGRLPFVGSEVDTRNWLDGLEHLQRMEPAPRFVIPGHGEESRDAAKAIAFTKEYIEFLRDRLRPAAKDLLPFDEAYARIDWSRYRDLPAFEEANRINAYNVYLELMAEAF
jgi:glyoxylase-like metal-dependent hydrolase (beta-lactamase superfamily II)